MTTPPKTMTDELPADLAERLTRLAAAQTAGSRPWPGVDQALRRSHRHRVAGVSVLTTVGVLLAATAFGGLLSSGGQRPGPASSPAASTSVPTQIDGTGPPVIPKTPAQAGFAGPVGGSLGSDDAWLAGLRQRMIAQTTVAHRPTISSAKDVLPLWAGDLDGARYAVVAFRISRDTSASQVGWATGVLSGSAGAVPSAMTLKLWNTSQTDGLPYESSALFVKAENPDAPQPGVVFVVGPKASLVQVVGGRRFLRDGPTPTNLHTLTKQGGAVWVGQLNSAELYITQYEVTGMDYGPTAGMDPTPLESAVAAIAEPGTDLPLLKAVSDTLKGLWPSSQEQPVFATSIRSTTLEGEASPVAAVVLRSPDGGFLYGFAQRWPGDTGGPGSDVHSSAWFPRPASFGSLASFMAAGREEVSPPGRPPYFHYLVIAPVGATTIRINGTTAAVHHRLAVLDLPDHQTYPPSTPDTQALNAAGKVIRNVQTISSIDAGPLDLAGAGRF